MSELRPAASFSTADGMLWNAFFGELKRFEAGRWRTVALFPRQQETPFRAKSLTANGPPWILLDRKGLWRLEHGPGGQDPQIGREVVREGGKSLRVHDAISWSGRSLLLATEAGLRVYDPGTKTTARADFPEPAERATVLVLDGLNRLWLGNEHGLWLSEPSAKAAEPLDRIAGVSGGGVLALARDPQHADGVIAALGPRCLAFVRAPQTP
jgi:ligand-binding sensor domain-containing protein